MVAPATIACANMCFREISMPSITRNLNIIARCGNQFRSVLLSGQRVSAVQASYLLHICAKPGMSQERLAHALHVNPSNAARQLSLLENEGFIDRRVTPQDKRLMEIHPTDKALAVIPRIREVNDQWNAYLTEGIPSEDLVALERMLDHMRSRAIAWDEKREAHAT